MEAGAHFKETTGLNFRTIPDPFGSFIKSIPPEGQLVHPAHSDLIISSEIVDVDQPGDPKPKLGIEVGAAREAREAEAVKKRQQREALERQRKEREEKETQEREKEAKAKEAREKEASERAAREKEKKDRERREKEAMERLKQSREREARERGGGRRDGEGSGSSSRIASLRKEVIDDEDQRSSRMRFDSDKREQVGADKEGQPELVEVGVQHSFKP